MELLSGLTIREEIFKDLRSEIDNLKASGISPTLAVIIVGDDPASKVYVGHKKKACEQLQIKSIEYALPKNTTQEELIGLVEKLNNDPTVHGILCQFPLPSHLSEQLVVEHIAKEKDVDCFHPYNLGRLASDNPTFMPITPYAIFQMLKRTDHAIKGKHVVIVGRGSTVGRPLSIMFSLKGWDATVTLCHSHTKEIRSICRTADILIAAMGKPKFITRDHVKQGAIVIDVGINRIVDENHPKGGYLVGDTDFKNLQDIASVITPVPGGVGPVTIAILMVNAVSAARIQNNLPPLDI